MYEISLKICRVVFGTAGKNDYCYRKGREGGGQRVMIEIIISVNNENDGRPLLKIYHTYCNICCCRQSIHLWVCSSKKTHWYNLQKYKEH